MESCRNLISIKNIYKKYSSVTALNNVTLDIKKGEFLSVFGPNGAGKSTLLKIISMQTRPSSGEAEYMGVSFKKTGDDFRRNFGVISHQPFVYENMTAMENLEFYASLYSVKNIKEKACELLQKLDLYGRRNDPVRSFSRGMLQRVSIARALIHSPEIIFLDEPYTGLDSLASEKLTNLLRGQLNDGKTVIMVTHDIYTGTDLATDIMIMRKGGIVYKEKKENTDIAAFKDIYLRYADNRETV